MSRALNPATYGVDLVRRTVLPDAPGVEINGWLVPIWAEAALVLAIGTALLAGAVHLFQKTD